MCDAAMRKKCNEIIIIVKARLINHGSTRFAYTKTVLVLYTLIYTVD